MTDQNHMMSDTYHTSETTPQHIPVSEQPTPVIISAEAVAYICLAVFVVLAFTLRLGIVPLTTDELPRALASWSTVEPDFAPTAPPDSALVQLGHVAAMSLLGASESTVRLPTALVGVLLVFSPLLFRRILGPARTFMTMLLLACSPVVLAASRLDQPVIWEAALGVLALWSLLKYTHTGQLAYAVLSTAVLVAVALLAGTTGHAFTLTLVMAFALYERITPSDEPDEQSCSMWDHLRNWPWLPGLGLAALLIFVVSTVFMLYPTGLNAVATAFGAGLAGWFTPAPDAPPFFALCASLLYEPILWIFGIIAVVGVIRRDTPSQTDLFLVAWLVVGGLITILYAGGTAANAIWLTLPLTALTAGEAVRLLRDVDGMLWYNEEDRVSNLFGLTVPGWARWIVAACTAGVLLLILMHVGGFARQLQVTNVSQFTESAYGPLLPSALILLVLLLLLGFISFTSVSIWGGTATLRGGMVGLLAVGIAAMLGSGWQIAYNRADDPRELWHTVAYGADVTLLRETLLQLADRETGGFNEMEVVVVTNDDTADDSALAWILRDFENTLYVRHPADARAQQVVLMEPTEEDPPLGGNYLGQTFTLSRRWDANLTALEFPAWWFQRATRTPPKPDRTVVLWLRQDIYEGVDVPGLR